MKLRTVAKQGALAASRPGVKAGGVDPELAELRHDTIIAAGQQWRPELEDAIERTVVALLLVTPDFLASDFIVETELAALEAAGAIGTVRYVGMQTYRTRFGNWPDVLLTAAGLATDGKIAARTRHVDWASGQPLQHLREATEDLGCKRLRYAHYDAWRARRIARQIADNDRTAIATRHAICQHYGGWLLAQKPRRSGRACREDRGGGARRRDRGAAVLHAER